MKCPTHNRELIPNYVETESTIYTCLESNCNYSYIIDETFEISLEEAKILNQWLRLHHGLFSSQPDYIQLLRLINGIGSFVDKHDKI
jgi:hypothetical protein